VSAPNPHKAAGNGRSNGVRPSLSSDIPISYLMLPAGVGTPRDFMAPNTYDETVLHTGEALNQPRPHRLVHPDVHHGPGVLQLINCDVLETSSATFPSRVGVGPAPSPLQGGSRLRL